MAKTIVVQTAPSRIPSSLDIHGVPGTQARLTHKITHKTKAALWSPRYPIRTLKFGPNRVLAHELTAAVLNHQPVCQPMRVLGLNHFNITASPDFIEKIKNFYVDVIGLTVGPRASLDHNGFWLYAGAFSILHLSARQQSSCDLSACEAAVQKSTHKESAKKGSAAKAALLIEGCFNHISLSCTGLAATIQKLTALEIPYKISELPDLGQTQIFVKDPAGIGVELTFSE